MGKFDVTSMRYLCPEHFRVLLSVEMGMKNHELVPLQLISSIASIHRGGTARALSDLAKNVLVVYERGKRYDGYRLTTLGYDFLSLRALCAREVIGSVGNKIGIGKESDVYIAGDPKLNDVVLKFHRLGRTCFRKLKEKRDYHQRRHYCSWLYLSRISALKEYSFLKALYSRKFPVPQPIDVCRHTVVMSLIDGVTLHHINYLNDPSKLYNKLMNIIVRLGNYGLIHGDFNEFNIMLTKDEEPIIIDFPQMISIDHLNAEFYFNRDVNCIRLFFQRKYNFEGLEWPKFSDIERRHNIDIDVEASGFTKKMAFDLNKAYDEGNFSAHLNNENTTDEDLDEEEDENEEIEEEKEEEEEDVKNLFDKNEKLIENNFQQSSTQFTKWLNNVQSELEKIVIDEQDCPELFEMSEESQARYKIEYDKVQIEAEKYINEEANSDNKSDNEANKFKKYEKVTRQKSVYSNGSTIAPNEIKKRLLKEKNCVKKQRLKAKGKHCAVNRARRENMLVIKEHKGWDAY